MGYFNKSLEDSSAESNVNYGSLAWKFSEVKNINYSKECGFSLPLS